MPGGGIRGRCIRVEQSFTVQSIELADVDPMNLRAAVHEEEKVPAVGEELRERMTPLLPRLDSRRGSGFPTIGGNADNRSDDVVGKDDRAVAVPRAPEKHLSGR